MNKILINAIKKEKYGSLWTHLLWFTGHQLEMTTTTKQWSLYGHDIGTSFMQRVGGKLQFIQFVLLNVIIMGQGFMGGELEL